jgi:perosamine synthetase
MTADEPIAFSQPYRIDQAQPHVAEAVASTWISGGSFIERFESAFNERIGTSHGLTMSNGTTALHAALLACEIGPGDEVIVPAYTFAAPVHMTLAVGAKPIYAEVDTDTWQLTAESAAEQITDRTRAIIAVNLYGNVCRLDALRELADRRGLWLIEDNAEACFSRYGGRCAGTWGHVGTFSFQATKTLTMGEGGYVVAGDGERLERMRIIRNHGMKARSRYWHEAVGFNFRLTNLQAAVGWSQLELADEIIARRKAIFAGYREALSGVEGITPQAFDDEVDEVGWAFAVRLDPSVFGPRDGVIERLAKAGIETRPGFTAFSKMPLYADVPRRPTAEAISESTLVLPSYTGLAAADLERIGRQLVRCAVGAAQ